MFIPMIFQNDADYIENPLFLSACPKVAPVLRRFACAFMHFGQK